MRGTGTFKGLCGSGMPTLTIALAAMLVGGCSSSSHVPGSVSRSASTPGWGVGDNLGKSVFQGAAAGGASSGSHSSDGRSSASASTRSESSVANVPGQN